MTSASLGSDARSVRRRERVGAHRAAAEPVAVRDSVLRLLDVVLAATAVVLLAPLMLAIALSVHLTSPGPAIFRQVRVGHKQRTFAMYKFRTMHHRCDDSLHREFVTRMFEGDDPRMTPGDGLYKLQADPRVTRVGAFLRRTSLDELPQLVNVLRDEMSLVGPRPSLPWEVPRFHERHLRRFDVKPGITGLWQVEGRNRLTMQEALELDVHYVSRRSIGLYVSILGRTLPAALLDREAR